MRTKKKLNRVTTIKPKEVKKRAPKLPEIKKVDQQTKLPGFSMEKFKFPALNKLNPGLKEQKKQKRKILDVFKRKK